MFFKKLVSIFTIAIIIISSLTPIARAEEKGSKYTTNIDTKTQDDLFNLKFDDIKDPFNWLKSRKTFSVLETDETGRKIYWFNVPNPQSIIYNQATSPLPTGYVGSGSIPSLNDGLYFVKIPERKNAQTAMEKYGFRIPSPAYAGETPRIEMSFMGVLIEENPVRFVINKIRGFFGGSIIGAPEKEDFYTLKYLTPSDYVPTKNTFERWIQLYWDKTMEEMESGQVLITGADDQGKKGGIQYVKETIITANGLEKVNGNPKKLNDELMEVLGKDYKDVVMNIITFGVQKETGKSFEQAPIRIMPYDIKSLEDKDSKNLVPDPRTVQQTPINIFGLDLNLGLDKIILNKINSIAISIGGFFSEMTVFLNGLTNFTVFEKMGLDVPKFWKSPIMSITTPIVGIILLFILLGHAYKVARGTGAIGKAIIESLVGFLILGVLTMMMTSPDKTYQAVKTISSNFTNLGTKTLELDPSVSILMGSGDASKKVDTAYWVPYFALWTDYNTSSKIGEKKQVISKDNPVPEAKDLDVPKIGDKKAPLWNVVLADSFTEGSSINKDAYRVVDHFMAPRLSVGEPPNLYTTKSNENYTKPVQNFFDLGILLLIVIIFFAVLFKVVLFSEFIYYLMIFPINLALSFVDKQKIKATPKEFMFSFLRVGLWDLVISFMILISMTTSGVVSLLFAVIIIIGIFVGISKLKYSNSPLTPITLKVVRRYI